MSVKNLVISYITKVFQPQCCLTFLQILALNVAQVFLNTYKHHHTETPFIFTIFLPCLDLGLFILYLCDLFFIFILIFIMVNPMNTDTLGFAWFFLPIFSLTLLIKVVLIEKGCSESIYWNFIQILTYLIEFLRNIS